MEVIFLNPNDSLNSSPNGRFQNIIGKMCYHTAVVFCDLIIPSNPEKVWMIGHSAGGEFTLSVIMEFTKWIIEHMKAFALTDIIESSGNEIQTNWGREHCVNLVQSDEHVNTPLDEGPMTMNRSAECRNHTLCTYICFKCLWEFFDQHGAAE